ncbi:hypothetical protein RJT34_17571 [Clitoria ternatea]|uniref:CBM20 domain-containing protein n=1 Tax=Clitoria ternatea TaxID=43366 RepID=A0AAN9PDW5_CLITE
MESLTSTLSMPIVNGSPKCASFVTNAPKFCFSPYAKKWCNFPFLKLEQNKGIYPVHALPSKQIAYYVTDGLGELANGEKSTVNIRFQLQCGCNFGEHFLIVGDDPSFGAWNPAKAVPMTWSNGHIWFLEKEVRAGMTMQFKLILKKKDGEIVWQPGPDRVVQTWETTNMITVCEDWDNAHFQKIVEESQGICTNEDVKEMEELSDEVEEQMQEEQHLAPSNKKRIVVSKISTNIDGNQDHPSKKNVKSKVIQSSH